MGSDPTRPSTEESPVQSTLDDHVECMETVARVEACLEGRPDQAWLARLRDELPTMIETLCCHFSQEAEGSLYQEVPVRYPRFSARLRVLLDEHADIVRRAKKTAEQADQLADAEPYQLQEFAARVHLLVAKIRRHEAEENEVVLSAHWQEFGTGD